MTSIQSQARSRDVYRTADDNIVSVTTVYGVAITIALSVLILAAAILEPGGRASDQQNEIVAEAGP